MSKYTQPHKETEDERLERFAKMARDWAAGKLIRNLEYKPHKRIVTDEELDKLLELNN
jgi:hypothetical protein